MSNLTKQEIDIHMGKMLRRRRTELGLSQEALAKSVGITFQQVQKYEKGANAMSASRVFEFALFMDTPVTYFSEALQQEQDDDKVIDLPSAASDRETLELMKAFSRINDKVMRKRLADLIRAVADDKQLIAA